MTAPSKIAAKLARELNLSLAEVRDAACSVGPFENVLRVRGNPDIDADTLDELREWARATRASVTPMATSVGTGVA